ncbi:MAG: YIP1 family protein [bacterium]|nr:YIP1 family protein [bacterium]
MDFDAIIKRVIGIITKPNEEWKKIKTESTTIGDLFTKYALILAAIPAVAGFIGNMLIGRSVLGFTVRVPVSNSLIWAIMMYIMSLVGVYIVAFIIDALAPSFGSQKDMVSSMKVAVYASTASWVAGVLYIIPALSILAVIAGLYSLYLLFLGIKIVKNPPQDKAVGYFVVVIIAELVLAFLIGFIVSAVAFGSAARYM